MFENRNNKLINKAVVYIFLILLLTKPLCVANGKVHIRLKNVIALVQRETQAVDARVCSWKLLSR